MSRISFRWRAAALALAGALALSGCAAGTPATGASDTNSGGAVTFTHMYGQTTIDHRPERVATWGWGSADAVLALGVMPVAIPADTYGAPDTGVTPWMQAAIDKVGGTPPTILKSTSDELPIEQLLATDPDVLIAPYSGLTQDEYDKVTAAGVPVVAPAKATWSTPWREVITDTGKALGLDSQATTLIDDLNGQVAAAAAAHPEFAGTTIAFASDTIDTFYLYLPADARVELLEDLGFTSAPSVTALDNGSATFYTTVSAENLDRIDADVIFVYAADDAALNTFLTSARTTAIPAVKKGAVASIVGNVDSDAVSPTALTLPYILPTLVDQLAQATAKAKA
ncbi:ABC transporter substrate-binding protein [Microbacterium sp. SORGH_AS_0888]|uniref:ABC transporter substrate-binding protein n=1 Tax=Microbacterium sp. SORGH_AS_0888 TaxID=3041791 RepID=UPI002784863B|nr:ABC transporter substrate-binding protein [Microbacterium sp. SORGH_AS_0888]MDQ1128429.1 iron complex transport system substrate-binding protein [Microbacterium sp. SORGH_AS_0888]